MVHQMQFARSHQAHRMDESCEHADGPGPAAESEQEDPVAGTPVLDEVGVGLHHVLIEAVTERQPGDRCGLLAEGLPGAVACDGADAGMVEDELLGVLGANPKEPQHVGVAIVDLVACAVHQHNDVPTASRTHGQSPLSPTWADIA